MMKGRVRPRLRLRFTFTFAFGGVGLDHGFEVGLRSEGDSRGEGWTNGVTRKVRGNKHSIMQKVAKSRACSSKMLRGFSARARLRSTEISLEPNPPYPLGRLHRVLEDRPRAALPEMVEGKAERPEMSLGSEGLRSAEGVHRVGHEGEGARGGSGGVLRPCSGMGMEI